VQRRGGGERLPRRTYEEKKFLWEKNRMHSAKEGRSVIQFNSEKTHVQKRKGRTDGQKHVLLTLVWPSGKLKPQDKNRSRVAEAQRERQREKGTPTSHGAGESHVGEGDEHHLKKPHIVRKARQANNDEREILQRGLTTISSEKNTRKPRETIRFENNNG